MKISTAFANKFCNPISSQKNLRKIIKYFFIIKNKSIIKLKEIFK